MSNLNLKIEDQQINFIRLLLRSPDVGDGWRRVSNAVRPIVNMEVEARPELFEIKDEEGALMIRLTSEGSVLAKYVA